MPKLIRRKNKLAIERTILDDLVIAAFAILSIILLSFQLLTNLSPRALAIISFLNIAIAILFLGEFIWRFSLAKSKRRFLIFHWWELLACIPVTSTTAQAFRGLGMVRLFYIFEALEIITFTARVEIIAEVAGKFTKHLYFLEAISTSVAVIFASSVLFFNFEAGHNANVHSVWDGLWWAMTTITTTGYGDIVPVTSAGRIMSIVLMILGTIATGAIAASFIKYFSRPHRKRHRLTPSRI